jgi:undecaprenyl pyrophosphate phosphatase UppP
VNECHAIVTETQKVPLRDGVRYSGILPTLFQVVVLAIVQGLAELLPVSSSAHVIVAEKLMGLDPSAPAMTLLLVMLHNGTMFAVIVYFWNRWRQAYFSSRKSFLRTAGLLASATAITGGLGEILIKLIKAMLRADAVRHGANSILCLCSLPQQEQE